MRKGWLLIVVMVLAAACGPVPIEPTAVDMPAAPDTPSAPAPSGDQPVVMLKRQGGMCPYGGCEWSFTIYADGAAVTKDGSGAIKEGKVTAEQMKQLRDLIEGTDFAAIKAKPFTGICPTAYDGQESIYAIQTSHGTENLASCTVVIDPSLPLFKWIDDLAGTIQAG